MPPPFLFSVTRDGNIWKDYLNKYKSVTTLVIALGYPKEEVIFEEICDSDDIKYYRNSNKRQHVPKIILKDLILNY